jgi:hypothetical protein
MITRQELLKSITFGQRVAEEESDVLATYFVETDNWRRLFAGDIDVIYGPKGSGKSALYSLLIARSSDLFDRSIVLVPGENPRGAPAFRDLVADPPLSEHEFISLWKLYFACLLCGVLDEYGMEDPAAKELRSYLQKEGLIRGTRSLQSMLKAVSDYVRRMIRPESVEAELEVEPATGLPKGVTGRIVFAEPGAAEKDVGLTSVDEILSLADKSLQRSGLKVWILLDRLDVAFAETPDLEANALRALFRVYLDVLGLNNVQLKIFLRTDIWSRITASGFREASHITKHMTIDWNRSSLLNLVVRRAIQNHAIQDFYRITPQEVLDSTDSQERFFGRMFSEQVEVGPNKPGTFDWMLGRTRDGTKKNAPRELIHL